MDSHIKNAINKYTEDEIVENYNKFIAFINKVFKDDSRLDKILHMYSEDELGMELSVAPASGKLHYHNAYIGGYVDHIMNVCKNAYKIKDVYLMGSLEQDFTDTEMFFAAIHHDLGKLGDGNSPYYVPAESEWHFKNKGTVFNINKNLHFMDVTDRALWLLNKYGIYYSETEMLAIKLADGLYNEATKPYLISWSEDFQLKTDLPYVIHWADNMAVRQERRILIENK